MELSTKTQSSLALFISLGLCAVFQNWPTILAFMFSVILFGLISHFDHADKKLNDDTKRQLKELREAFETFKLAGMRR